MLGLEATEIDLVLQKMWNWFSYFYRGLSLRTIQLISILCWQFLWISNHPTAGLPLQKNNYLINHCTSYKCKIRYFKWKMGWSKWSSFFIHLALIAVGNVEVRGIASCEDVNTGIGKGKWKPFIKYSSLSKAEMWPLQESHVFVQA